MIFRKEFLFVVATIMIFAGTQTAKAMENPQNPLDSPVTSSYDFKNDPYLLEWSFEIEKAHSPRVTEQELTLEDKILNRWKEKQARLWTTLPKEPFVINASAYTAAADECGKSDGITASGLKVTENRTLACPPSFPFGTKMSIEGMGEFRCEDRGGAIKGNHIDIYMETKTEAFAFGRQHLTAQVIE